MPPYKNSPFTSPFVFPLSNNPLADPSLLFRNRKKTVPKTKSAFPTKPSVVRDPITPDVTPEQIIEPETPDVVTETTAPKDEAPTSVFDKVGGAEGADTSVSDNTNQLRADEDVRKQEADDTMTEFEQMQQDFLGLETFAESEAGQQALADLDTVRESIRVLSEGDLASIKQAGVAAGLEYDPLIAEAREQKRLGMPKAIIGGGERGGFMSTQFAGAAALAPTEGGNFIGAGGELQNIQGVYDRNISMLQAKKQAAIAAAEGAHRTAIRTGKQQDFDNLKSAIDVARKASEDTLNLAQEKVDAVATFEKQKQARVEFGQEQEDREIEGVAGTLADSLAGLSNEEALNLIKKESEDKGVDFNRLLDAVNTEAEANAKFEADLTTKNFNIAKNLKKGEIYVDKDTGRIIEGTGDRNTIEVTRIVGNQKFKDIYEEIDGEYQLKQTLNQGKAFKSGGGSGGSGGGDLTDSNILSTANLVYEAAVDDEGNIRFDVLQDRIGDLEGGKEFRNAVQNMIFEVLSSPEEAGELEEEEVSAFDSAEEGNFLDFLFNPDRFARRKKESTEFTPERESIFLGEGDDADSFSDFGLSKTTTLK